MGGTGAGTAATGGTDVGVPVAVRPVTGAPVTGAPGAGVLPSAGARDGWLPPDIPLASWRAATDRWTAASALALAAAAAAAAAAARESEPDRTGAADAGPSDPVGTGAAGTS